MRFKVAIVNSLLVSVLFISTGLAAAASLPQLKAAFLYNFVHFVSWPDDAFQSKDEPFKICVADTEAMFKLLQATVRGEQIKQRVLQVEHLSGGDSNTSCHLVFVGEPQGTEFLVRYRKQFAKNTLIVSDIHESVLQGAMIEMRFQDGRLKLFIHRHHAEQAGLIIRANLLSVAQLVGEE